MAYHAAWKIVYAVYPPILRVLESLRIHNERQPFLLGTLRTDRTSEGLKPMCASVCPSEALWYGTIDEFRENRTGSLLRDFMFGRQEVRTKVYTVVDDLAAGPIDVMRGQAASWLDDPFALESGGT